MKLEHARTIAAELVRSVWRKTDPLLDSQRRRVKEITKMLKDGEYDMLSGIAAREPEMVGHLIKALGHSDKDIRKFAAMSLENAAADGVELTEAVPSLVECLKNGERSMRMSAANTLVNVALNAERKALEDISSRMVESVGSSWTEREAFSNTVAFSDYAILADRVLKVVKRRMDEAA